MLESRLEKHGKRPQTAELEVKMLFNLTTVILGRLSFLKQRLDPSLSLIIFC